MTPRYIDRDAIAAQLDALARDARRLAVSGGAAFTGAADAFTMAVRVVREAPAVPDPVRACPCFYTTPCHEDCSCVRPFMSRACARCCTQGSLEQRRAAAERIARTLDAADPVRGLVERLAAALEDHAARHLGMYHGDGCPASKHADGDCDCPGGTIDESAPCPQYECECCLSIDVNTAALTEARSYLNATGDGRNGRGEVGEAEGVRHDESAAGRGAGFH